LALEVRKYLPRAKTNTPPAFECAQMARIIPKTRKGSRMVFSNAPSRLYKKSGRALINQVDANDEKKCAPCYFCPLFADVVIIQAAVEIGYYKAVMPKPLKQIKAEQ